MAGFPDVPLMSWNDIMVWCEVSVCSRGLRERVGGGVHGLLVLKERCHTCHLVCTIVTA